jgi:hypothetical protein
MAVTLPPAAVRDPDALALFMRTQLGLNVSGDNELALWCEQSPPQPIALTTVTTKATGVLTTTDTTTLVAVMAKRKGGK